MDENKLIVNFSLITTLIESYSMEFSLENSEKINKKELEEFMEAALDKVNGIIEEKRRTSSEEELDELQKQTEKMVSEEIEDIILNLMEKMKKEL